LKKYFAVDLELSHKTHLSVKAYLLTLKTFIDFMAQKIEFFSLSLKLRHFTQQQQAATTAFQHEFH